MSFYSVSHADAGLVSTCLFFAYGVGQFINGFFCKKYNLKWVIFTSLMVSGAVNLAVALTPSFEIVKYLWLINGLSLSVLWPCVIRMLSECISKKYMARATVVIGTTVAVGTLTIYAASALFTRLGVFKMAFTTAAAVMPAVAVVWLFAIPKISARAKALCRDDEEEVSLTPEGKCEVSRGFKQTLYFTIGVLCFCAVATNLIKDGLTTWIPSILKENYGLDPSFSIILSLALPLVALFGNFFAVNMHKRVPNFVIQCGISFFMAGIITAVVIGGLSLGSVALTLLGFAMVCFLVSSCNSLITSIFPLMMKRRVNSGGMAGLLNGFCYVGSTIASYGLGLVADNWGWNAVFWLLFGVCVLVCVVALIYRVISAKMEKLCE